MAASVAYPVASLLEDELRKPRTPRLTTGSDNWRTDDTNDVCNLEFLLACIHMQYAISSRGSKPTRLVNNMRNANHPSPLEKPLCDPPTLLIGPPPPPYEDSKADSPPDYTTTESLAVCQLQATDLPPKYAPGIAQNANKHDIILDPCSPKVDFSSVHNVRAHAKKKKGAPVAKKADPWGDDEKKDEEGSAEKDGEGGNGDGAGGAGGNGGDDDDDGKGGDDWNDWDTGKKKKGKKGKKAQEEEEEQKKREEEEAKQKEEEEAAGGAKDEWGTAGGDEEWGTFSSGKKGKKTKKKAQDEDELAKDEPVDASTNVWADTTGGAEGADDTWGDFTAAGKKKKGKKTKAQTDESAPAATESFQDISLNDELDLGVPKISLSFDEPVTKKEEPSSGFGIGGWGSSWSFGGVGGKKEEEKPKEAGSFWKKSNFSEFNFGFGGAGGDPKDLGNSKKDDDDEEDGFLPSWGTAGGTTAKKDKKSKKFGIEEVDDPLPDAKSNEKTEETWGGWSAKKSTDTDKKPGTKSWDTWESTTTSKTDKKKSSWADLVEEDEEDEKSKDDPLAAVKEEEEDGWGAFSAAKTKKKGKTAIQEVTTEPASKGKDDIWGWAKDKKDAAGSQKKDDDTWGEISSSKTKKGKNDKEKSVEPEANTKTAKSEPPPLSILKGLPIGKDGKIENLLGEVIGELVEADMGQANRAYKNMYMCDEEGNVKNSKGKIMAKAKTIAPETRVVPEPEVVDADPEPEKTSTPDISILDGLKVEADGKILDVDGNPIGELVDGDAKVIAKRKFMCNAEGEIRDKKRNIVGHAIVLPVVNEKETAKEEPEEEGEEQKPEEKPAEDEEEQELPDISILEGLTLESDGKFLLNEDGVAVGELIEGDSAIIIKRKYVCSAAGTFSDKKKKIVGRCQVLPTPSVKKPNESKDEPEADGATEAEPPPLSILDNLCIENDGTILSLGDKTVIGKVIEGDATKFASMMYFCDAEGNVVNYTGKPVGKVCTIAPAGSEAPKAAPKEKKKSKKESAEKDKEDHPPEVEEEKPTEKISKPEKKQDIPDISILKGLFLEKDGTILNFEGEVVGKLVEGDAKVISKKMYMCDAEGQFKDKKKNVIGRAEVLVPESSQESNPPEEASKEPEVKDEPSTTFEELPPLSILKDCTIEPDGKILNDDGEIIGELTEGDASRLSSISAKCDDEGNVIGSKKKKVGKVKTVAPGSQAVADEGTGDDDAAEDGAEEEAEDNDKVSLSMLKGRLITVSGDVLGDDDKVIGKLVEGNAKKLSKGMATCDEEGNVYMKNKNVGRVEVVQPEKPEREEEPEKEEAPPPLSEEPTAPESVSLELLEGRTIELSGDILDDDLKVIGKLVEGNAKQLNKKRATCDGNGAVWHGTKKVGACEVVQSEAPKKEAPPPSIPAVEKEPEPEPTLEILDGRYIEADGNILDDEFKVIGKLVKGDVKKLVKAMAICDGNGGVWAGVKKVGKCELVLPETTEKEAPLPPPPPPAEKEPEPEPEKLEPPSFAILDGRKIEKSGEVFDDDGNVIAKLVAGSASKLYKQSASCHADGTIWAKNKEIKDAKLELVLPEEPEAPEPPPPPPPAAVVEEPPKPEASPFAILDGRKIDRFGDIFDDNYELIGKLVEGNATKLHKDGATCDAEGKVWAKGKHIKTARVELEHPHEPEAPEPPPAPEPEVVVDEPPQSDFSVLDGLKIDRFGDIFDGNYELVGKLVEGNATKLNKDGATCDAEGKVWSKGKLIKTAKVELVLPDEPVAPEPVAPEPEPIVEEFVEPDFSILDGLKIDKFGDVWDDDWNLVAKLVEGDATKLNKNAATCDAEGKVWSKGKLIKSARVELVAQVKAPEPEPDGPVSVEEAVKEYPTWADCEGRSLEKDGTMLDDDGKVIAKLIDGLKHLEVLSKVKAKCDAEGVLWHKEKPVTKAKLELVMPEKKESAEPEKTEETNDWMGDGWGTSKKDKDKKKAKTKEEPAKTIEIDPVKDLLDSINNPDSTWGDPWASTATGAKKKKRSSVAASSNADDPLVALLDTTSQITKSSKNEDWNSWDTPSKTSSKDKKKKGKKQEEETSPKAAEPKEDEATISWGDSFGSSWGTASKKDKKTPKTEDSDPLDDSKIMKAADVEESKSDHKDDVSGFAFLNKKDKKKKSTKNAPVEVIDDLLDVPLHESANVEETKSNVEDPDWAFASNRVKAKKGKKVATPAKDDEPVARAPTPPEDDDKPTSKSLKAIEAAPEDKKSKKSKKDKSDGADLSRSITKESTKSKASDKSKNLIDVEEDDDDLAPDDSASVTKEPKESPKAEPPKAKKEPEKKGWGSMFSRSKDPPKPTLAQLRKEREERERKDQEERESQEQQEREENERLERERIEEERLEQERLEQEEREKALEEAAKVKKEADSAKKGKKVVKGKGKGKAVEVAPPPPPPPPPPVEAAEDTNEDEESPKDDPFATWGLKSKSSTKKATKKDSTNKEVSLSKPDAKKVPETEVLPTSSITNIIKSASASAAVAKGIKSTSSTSKPIVKGLSVAERIKALQGETKLKDSVAQTLPVPPPPPPAPPVVAKAAKEPENAVESSSKKLSKKQTTASKTATAKATTKRKEAEAVPEKKRSLSKTPGGFPDSDESSDSSDEEPLIDVAPPTPPPEPEMGAKVVSKSAKKAAVDKKSAKSSKATPLATPSKSTKAAKPITKKEVIVDTSSESESDTEAEQEKAAANAEGTQGSGSTTAVDDSQAADRKLPTPPPDAKASSPSSKKERPKVLRQAGTSSWGFWATATPKQIREKAKDGTPAPLKGNSKPMMVRARPRKESVAASGTETEKKITPPKPTPKRAATFSLFGPTPTRRQSVRANGTPKSTSRPQSRRVSPERTAGKEIENDDEVLHVSSKAAKVMGISASGGPPVSRRASVKSKGVPDPYAIDDEPVMVDNGLDIYAESSPVATTKSKRKSIAEATSSTNDDAMLVDVETSEGTRAAPGTDSQDLAGGTRSRKPSPVKNRSQSRTTPRTSSGGIMGIFGLSRSKTIKELKTSDPSFGPARSKRDGYGSDDGMGARSKRTSAAYDDEYERRDRRRRKSRRDVDEEGFTTDAPGVTTDYEEADRKRAERRAARRAEEKRFADEARATEERSARRRDRDAEKERDREARRAARAEQIRQEEEARRREDKEARRAARRAREDERIRLEEQTRLDEQDRIAKEERRARRREREKDRDLPRDSKDKDLPREADPVDRPRGDRRRSSYMEDDYARRSSRRTPGERSSRRVSRGDPIGDYFDPRNAGQSSATPYLGSDKDKTSSWVESLSKEAPLPIPPEDTATVIEPPPGTEPHSSDDDEVRRKMQQRSKRRESYRESGTRGDSGRGDRPRDSERRKRRDRDSPQVVGVKSSDSGGDKERRRRSVYQEPLPEDLRPQRRSTYQEYSDWDQKPAQTKRGSWFKKIF